MYELRPTVNYKYIRAPLALNFGAYDTFLFSPPFVIHRCKDYIVKTYLEDSYIMNG